MGSRAFAAPQNIECRVAAQNATALAVFLSRSLGGLTGERVIPRIGEVFGTILNGPVEARSNKQDAMW